MDDAERQAKIDAYIAKYGVTLCPPVGSKEIIAYGWNKTQEAINKLSRSTRYQRWVGSEQLTKNE